MGNEERGNITVRQKRRREKEEDREKERDKIKVGERKRDKIGRVGVRHNRKRNPDKISLLN